MFCRSAPAAAPRATALAACLTISSGDCGTRGSRVVAASDTIFGDCGTRLPPLETGGSRVVAQSAIAAGHRPRRSIAKMRADTARGEGAGEAAAVAQRRGAGRGIARGVVEREATLEA
eukprot:scaffold96741_cov64-Phaeocystis_antarctica.AAC.4